MFPFRSYRGKLQAALLALGLAAIAVAGVVASVTASTALRQATFDRLNAIRETRARQIERFFGDASNQLEALASDEAIVQAVQDFRAGWEAIPPSPENSPASRSVRSYYERDYAPRIAQEAHSDWKPWFPSDPRTRTLQAFYLAGNPHPVRAKDLLLTVPEAGPYGRAHTRHHPTLHRYLNTFGFYDIFLVDAVEGRILYTVFKETDLGVKLTSPPYDGTALGRAFARALTLSPQDAAVIEDYRPYAPSYFAPAAFLAAPVWQGGVKIGIIAVQVSIEEVNRVMTGQGRWREEGLGRTGHAYIVGDDGTLRSDVRFEIENPEAYYAQLQRAGIDETEIDRIRRYRTGILNFKLAPQALSGIATKEAGLDEGTDFRGIPVLRSHSHLPIQDLEWTIVAEIESAEAFAPIHSLRLRILATGAVLAALLFFAARGMAASVTRPVLSLAAGARLLGGREFGTRVAVETKDEIGELADSFNRMAENLERTTVSREELEVLAGRLITAQEKERSRIARELHDDFSQRLAALAIEAGRIQQTDEPGMTEEVRGRLERMRQRIGALGDDVHGISRRLHPATLEDLGLAASLESECRGFFERGGPPVDLDMQEPLGSIPPEIALAAFRMVQESLRNVEKYASAQIVTVRLRTSADRLDLVIQDDGIGFDRSDPKWRPGLGLASMEERTKLLGGKFEVVSSPGMGTTVSATLTWRQA